MFILALATRQPLKIDRSMVGWTMLLGLLHAPAGTVRDAQQFELRARMGPIVAEQALDYADRLADLHPMLRLPLASLAFPTLRRRPRPELRQFTDLTFPMLTPTMVMVGIMTISGYFQLFAEPYVMTQGGPLRSTVSVLYFMYEEGFRWWNLGNASAVAFLLFVVIFAVSWVLLRFDREPGASA